MAIEQLVTNTPISDPGDPSNDRLEKALHRLADEGVDLELDEHQPNLGSDLTASITGTRVHECEPPSAISENGS